MRVVIQRVSRAAVRFAAREEKIDKGLVVFLAVGKDDRIEDIDYLVQKIINLRIFSDAQGLMNRTILDERGGILLIPQFTLYARTRKGNRPDFIDAAEPTLARKLFKAFTDSLQAHNLPLKLGKFGALMQVSLTNDGPVTIIIDSKDRNIARKQSSA